MSRPLYGGAILLSGSLKLISQASLEVSFVVIHALEDVLGAVAALYALQLGVSPTRSQGTYLRSASPRSQGPETSRSRVSSSCGSGSLSQLERSRESPPAVQ